MEYLKLFITHIIIPKEAKVIKATEKAHLWLELIFLYVKLHEFVGIFSFMSDHCAHTLFEDNAAITMIERSYDAWEALGAQPMIQRCYRSCR
jgi:clathrin heavy chain